MERQGKKSRGPEKIADRPGEESLGEGIRERSVEILKKEEAQRRHQGSKCRDLEGG